MPRVRLVGENDLGSILIVTGLHSLLQMALLNHSLFGTVHVLALQVKASWPLAQDRDLDFRDTEYLQFLRMKRQTRLVNNLVFLFAQSQLL